MSKTMDYKGLCVWLPYYLVAIAVFCSSLYAGIYNLMVYGYVGTYIKFTEPIGINCTHYAAVVAVCFVFALDRLSTKNNRFQRIFCVIAFIYFCSLLLLLTSRTAILASFLVGLSYVIVKVVRSREYKFLWLPVVFLSVIIVAFNCSEWGRFRRDATLMRLRTAELNTILPYRLPIYKIAVEAIGDRPLIGYGKKGAQLELNRRYELEGLLHPLKHSYHSHNQYLQYALYGGLGLAFFLVILSVLILIVSDYLALSLSTMFVWNLTFLTDAPLVDPFVRSCFYLIVVGYIVSIFYQMRVDRLLLKAS